MTDNGYKTYSDLMNTYTQITTIKMSDEFTSEKMRVIEVAGERVRNFILQTPTSDKVSAG